MADPVFRERAWMCAVCGYVMDAASPSIGAFAIPKEDDLSLCINCGLVYVRHGNAWVPMTKAERLSLDDEDRESIAELRRARSAVIREDLIKGRGGRA
jgi:hypothetical protein